MYDPTRRGASGSGRLPGCPHGDRLGGWISLDDSAAGMFAAVGILTGLYWRDALGDRGQVVDVSLLEACFALIAGWKRAHDGSESDARLNATDVVCGPIYSVADIVEDPHFRARDMLITHADLEFGECVGPGVVPKFWQTPGTIRWPGTWKEGSRNSDVHGHLLGLPAREPVALKREGVL